MRAALIGSVGCAYYDFNHIARYQAVRRITDAKLIEWVRPMGDGRWEPNLRGVTPFLYKLPELTVALEADPKGLIFIAEDELLADSLWSFGLDTTCIPHMPMRWRWEYAHPLAGRELVLMPRKVDSPWLTQAAHGLRAIAATLRCGDPAWLSEVVSL